MKALAAAFALAIGVGAGATQAATVDSNVTVTLQSAPAVCENWDTGGTVDCRAKLSFQYLHTGAAFSGILNDEVEFVHAKTGASLGAMHLLWLPDEVWSTALGKPYCIDLCSGFSVGADGRLLGFSWFNYGSWLGEHHRGNLMNFGGEWSDTATGSYYSVAGTWSDISYSGLPESPAPVPLPASVVLLGGALAGLGLVRKKVHRSA